MLRLSLLPSEKSSLQVWVYEGEAAVALPEVNAADRWTLLQHPLQGNAAVRVVMQSEQPYHLASCRVDREGQSAPLVLLYLVDTLRKDHLGCYYYPLDTSPAIDAFAKDGVIFRELMPMSSWTRPSVASLLTGTMDYTHHALSLEDHLRDGVPSLAGALGEQNWATCGIVANPSVGSLFGFGKDFSWFQDVWEGHISIGWQADVDAVDKALNVLDEYAGEPLCLYLHVMAPHREYEPPKEYAERFMPEQFVGTRAQVRLAKDMARYDAEIRFADDQFARVVQRLKESGRYDNALIVFLSDHGEQFFEHGEWAHANTLHYEELGVPLIVKLPGNAHAGAEVRQPVQMADVAPTMLQALGLQPAAAMEGRSTMPLITLQGDFPATPVVARLRFKERHYVMAQTPELKYLYDATLGESSWFDLVKDPLEYQPLRQAPEGGQALKDWADAFTAHAIPAKGEASPPLSEQQRKDLEALGYL